MYVNDDYSRPEEFSVTERMILNLYGLKLLIKKRKISFANVFTDTQTQILQNF